ncbi:unnamed protein product [Prorocentrum cordatum]|uniref:Uncharacterized protein n=1 Tax=Prorocentrum cordatum TaxID=2364126 RepID=A0ABN9WGZ3_9DINO|nr:unnamed protein product [Polarella glacialis]
MARWEAVSGGSTSSVEGAATLNRELVGPAVVNQGRGRSRVALVLRAPSHSRQRQRSGSSPPQLSSRRLHLLDLNRVVASALGMSSKAASTAPPTPPSAPPRAARRLGGVGRRRGQRLRRAEHGRRRAEEALGRT